jgi:hypothetical protein
MAACRVATAMAHHDGLRVKPAMTAFTSLP